MVSQGHNPLKEASPEPESFGFAATQLWQFSKTNLPDDSLREFTQAGGWGRNQNFPSRIEPERH